MTTVSDDNVHNFALEGSFDDAQNLVKALFADKAFAANAHLAAVNSINFARIAAQCVYYFTAAAALGRTADLRRADGQFRRRVRGRGGAAHGRCPSSASSLPPTPTTSSRARSKPGVYETGQAQPTLSPSMDIQVASNFERALFEASGRDADWLQDAMGKFAAIRRLDIPANALAYLRERYVAGRASDEETLATMARIHRETGILIDPHTAVAVAAAAKTVRKPAGPFVVLSTAHPAKFPEAVAKATGLTPDLPPPLADLSARRERYDIVPNDLRALNRMITERIAPHEHRNHQNFQTASPSSPIPCRSWKVRRRRMGELRRAPRDCAT